ncbi:MAG: tetratricopeptide repeat protein, partial [Gammaproteobacteria bacterium]|nr:tetratricopeptide repeat protein [Gammaproteobacteria bacterium]
IGGLVLGAAAVFGWREWQAYQIVRAEQASSIYEEMWAAYDGSDTEAAAALVSELKNDYAATPYGVLAAFAAAKAAVEAEDFTAAVEELRWAMSHSDDDAMRLVARLRLGRTMLAGGQAAEVPALLDAVNPGAFAPLYNELKGDAYVALGDVESARAAYQEALTAVDGESVDTELIQMKIDNADLNASAEPAEEANSIAEPAGENAVETAGGEEEPAAAGESETSENGQ